MPLHSPQGPGFLLLYVFQTSVSSAVRQPDQSQQADAGNEDENLGETQNQAEPAEIEGEF